MASPWAGFHDSYFILEYEVSPWFVHQVVDENENITTVRTRRYSLHHQFESGTLTNPLPYSSRLDPTPLYSIVSKWMVLIHRPSDPLNNTQNSFLHFWVFPARAWLGRDDWLDFQYSSIFIVADVTYILAFVSLLIQDKKSMPIDLEFGAYSIRLQAVLSERARALQTPVSETRGRLNIFPTYQDQNGRTRKVLTHGDSADLSMISSLQWCRWFP